MATDRRHRLGRLLLIGVSLALLVTGGVTVLRLAAGTPSAASGRSAPVSGAAAAIPATASPAETATSPHAAAPATAAAKPGVPIRIDIPIGSAHHPTGVRARITAHPLNADRTLYVPPDPTEVAWASQDAMPGSARGTAILVSHVNFVVHGRTVAGAFADLAQYARTAIGKRLTLTLGDGRTLTYRIVAGREYPKDELAGDPALRKRLYDQSSAFGPARRPSGRLLLVSCGGDFDPTTGAYDDNVFLYALPV